ncbi:MAG: Rpn family recombination-promoting nuclease/putative transposase, partial [Geitlerinemataceae cyanobacterium]
MNTPQTDYDTPWKDALEQYFPDFMAFFFPNADREIDWSRGYEFLDQELQQIVRDAELGKRLLDKLVKIYLNNGEEAWVLVHIEVQSQEETDFAQRMFVYHYRIYDRYQRRVASLAVLGDDRSSWRPHHFGYQLFDCQIQFDFPIVKLLDYQQHWSSLDASLNPFATVVMAHLKAKETTTDRRRRKEWKLLLTRRLYEKGYQRQDIINLFYFIDWMMTLPVELEQQFLQEVANYEEEQKMPYVSSVERLGIQKGLEQGRQEGRQEGRIEGLLTSIELLLIVKFGTESLSVFPTISNIKNIDKLQELLTSLLTFNTVEEIRPKIVELTGESETSENTQENT